MKHTTKALLFLVYMALGIAMTAPAFAQLSLLYTVDGQAETILEIDAKSMTVLRVFPAPAPVYKAGLAVNNAGELFFATPPGLIFKMDVTAAGGGKLLSVLPCPPGADPFGAHGLAYGTTSFGPTLFGLDNQNETIYLMNPQDGSVFKSYTTPFNLSDGLEYDPFNKVLWVGDFAQTDLLYALDPETGALLMRQGNQPWTLPSPGDFLSGIAFLGNRMFVSDRITGLIYELNPVTGAVLGAFNFPGVSPFALTGITPTVALQVTVLEPFGAFLGEPASPPEPGGETSFGEVYELQPVPNALVTVTDEDSGAIVVMDVPADANGMVLVENIPISNYLVSASIIREGSCPQTGNDSVQLENSDAGKIVPTEVILPQQEGPTLFVIGPNPLILECGLDSFADPGFISFSPCDPAPVITVDDVAVDPAVPGDYKVTYLISDSFVNSAEDFGLVGVVDTSPPTITCPGPVVVGNDPGQCGALVSFAAEAGDFCGVPSVVYEMGTTMPLVITSPYFFGAGTTTVTATAVDAAGLSTSCSFDVTVLDTEAPVLNLTLNVDSTVIPVADGQTFIVECGDPFFQLPAAGAADNCDGDLSGVVSIPNAPDLSVPGVQELIWSVTDAANNTSSVGIFVDVRDTLAPELLDLQLIPQSLTVSLSAQTVDVEISVDELCQLSEAVFRVFDPQGGLFYEENLLGGRVGPPADSPAGEGTAGSVVTGTDNFFTSIPVPPLAQPGIYPVELFLADAAGNQATYGSMGLAFPPGADAAFEILPAPAVRVTILEPGPQGNPVPLAGAEVSIFDNPTEGETFSEFAITDAAGVATFPGVPVGSYSLNSFFQAQGFCPQDGFQSLVVPGNPGPGPIDLVITMSASTDCDQMPPELVGLFISPDPLTVGRGQAIANVQLELIEGFSGFKAGAIYLVPPGGTIADAIASATFDATDIAGNSPAGGNRGQAPAPPFPDIYLFDILIDGLKVPASGIYDAILDLSDNFDNALRYPDDVPYPAVPEVDPDLEIRVPQANLEYTVVRALLGGQAPEESGSEIIALGNGGVQLEPVPGVVVALVDDATLQVVDQFSSDANGMGTFLNVRIGDYTVEAGDPADPAGPGFGTDAVSVTPILDGLTIPGIVEIFPIAPAPFEEWAAAAGLSGADAAPDADADGDTLSNLYEAFAGSDPGDASSRNAPSITVEDGYLTLTVKKGATGLGGIVPDAQVTENLEAWEGGESGATIILIDDAVTFKARDTVPLRASPCRFIRLHLKK